MAEKPSQALDRQITNVDVPPEAMMDALLGFGIPQWQAAGLMKIMRTTGAAKLQQLLQEFMM